MRTTRLLVPLALAALAPRPAPACGGFFCNQPDSPFGPPPVTQTAENVLFAMDRLPSGQSRLEAHVQIFYSGTADKFSWVVPVDSEPKLDVGSDSVFRVLDGLTRPQFRLEWQVEGTCREEGGGLFGFRRPRGEEDSPGGAGVASGPSAGAPVDVRFRGDVGPYDAAVIRSDDPQELKKWLREHMYFVSPEAERLVDDYVREQKFFVALRLLPGRGTTEIQPIVLRFDGPGPCVPLRLTAIAAIADLKINLWVLGEHRVVPENFFEIKLNEARIDWFSGGRNYEELLKQGANEAGGNAFAVDYAGPTVMLRNALFRPGQFSAARLATATTPPEAIQQLTSQAVPRDATLLALLQKHIPMPASLRQMGLAEQQFYNSLPQYWASHRAEFAPFDGRAFAADVDAKMMKPLENAQRLFDTHRTLTRLATFISPEEMLTDPIFKMNATLPAVPAVRTAQAIRMCGDREFEYCAAPVRLALGDGRSVLFSSSDCSNTTFARGQLDSMPAMEVGWKREEIGEGAVRFDNQAKIREAIAAHNLTVETTAGCDCAIGGRPGGGNAAALLLGGLAGAAALARALGGRKRRRS